MTLDEFKQLAGEKGWNSRTDDGTFVFLFYNERHVPFTDEPNYSNDECDPDDYTRHMVGSVMYYISSMTDANTFIVYQ